ncbi:MAG: fibronectin-binding autotransporter adhesin [Verrucomicrobiota bacterium]
MLSCKPSGTGFAFVPSGAALLFCALIFLATGSTSRAAGFTWNGNGGNTNWSTTGNWNLGSVPISGSAADVYFAGTTNTGTLATPLNQNIATTFQLNNLFFSSGGGNFFLGGGDLAFTGAANTITQSSSGTQNIANNIVASANSTITLNLTGLGTGVVTLSGSINAGSGNRDYAVTKTGASTFSLTGASNYGGATTVSGGVLNIRNATALGTTASGTTVATGAALQIQGGITVGTEALTLNGSGIASDGAFRNISGNNSFGGAITFASASTIASDAGTLTLSGGIVNGGFAVTFGGSSNVTSSGVISGTGVLIKNGSGTLTLSNGLNSFSGGSTLNGGTVVVISGSLGATTLATTINAATLEAAATFATPRNFTLGSATSTIMVDPTQTYTVSGIFSGTGALNKTGSGTLILSGANTYAAATNISAGTLREGTGNVIPNTSAVTVASGATYDLNSFSETIGSLAGGGTVTSGAAGALTLAAGADDTSTTFSGVLEDGTGAISFTKAGTGTLTLTGTNTYSGATVVSAGVLDIEHSSALGTTAAGTTVSSGAALQIQGGISVGNEALTLNGSGISSTGAFRNLSGNNSFAGALTLGSASTIYSDAGTLTLSGGIVNGGFTATFSGPSNTTESGVISGTGALNKTGAGTTTVSGTNTYTGSTTISSGTLQVNANNALGTVATGTTVSSGATLKLNGVNYSTAEGLTLNGSGISNGGALTNSGTSTFAGAINIATNATISPGGGTLNLTGGIAKNGITLTIAGGGTLNITTNGITGGSPNSDLVIDGTTVVLSAANSYNGPTTVQNSGTLKLGNSDVLPTSPQTPLTVNTSSVFDLASYNDGVASLSGDNTAIVKNSTVGTTSTFAVNPGSGVSTTFAGVISGTNGGTQGNIALQKTGAGEFTLTGVNTYSGATTISGGTLTADSSSGNALGSTSSIVVNSGGTLLLAGANDQINNAATVTLAGGTFNKGNVSEGSASSVGMGALTLTATGSHIDFGTGTVGVLTFASFTPGAYTFLIDNWTGTVATLGGGSTDRLIFDSNQSLNLSSFNFTGYAPGAIEFDLGGGYYEVVPAAVPEPATYISGLLALAAVGFHHRKQIRALFRLRIATK